MSPRALALCASLAAVPLAGCAAGLATLQALTAAAQGSQWLGAAIDTAEAGSEAWLARHPSRSADEQIAAALRRARLARAALDAALAVASAADAGDVAAARSAALDAYSALYSLLDELGVLEGVGPAGGVDGEAPDPGTLTLPAPGDIASGLCPDQPC